MQLVISKFELQCSKLSFAATVEFDDVQALRSPRLTLQFDNGTQSRLVPLPTKPYQAGSGRLTGAYVYDLSQLFFGQKQVEKLALSFLFRHGEEQVVLPFSFACVPEAECFSIEIREALLLKNTKPVTKERFAAVKQWYRSSRKEQAKMLIKGLFSIIFTPFRLLKLKENRVTFASNRRQDLTGNPACVYNRLVQDKSLDIKLYFNNGRFGRYDPIAFFRFCYLYATSKVVLVDDYFHFISFLPKPKHVVVVQLWHACGAFKTFGFSRLGKDTKLTQYSDNHRQYDVAIVSGEGVRDCYAEGFGIALEHVIATGVPRTDLLFDAHYQETVQTQFFAAHPTLRGKKILLFAPTFRGGGKGNAYYPLSQFDPERVCDILGDEYAILVKFHPYQTERYTISPSYRDRVVDCSDQSELNDLLFVSDLVITDYSSVVFEAALLKIPMVFYAFDLDEYIASRDFYVDFKTFVPGPIVTDQTQLITAIPNAIQNPPLMDAFVAQYLTGCDGQASVRVAQLIQEFIAKEG